MDVHVAPSAERNALAFTCDHDFHPERLLPTPLFIQIGSFTDVVHFHFFFGSAHVARILQ
jgi:hypothetical protein